MASTNLSPFLMFSLESLGPRSKTLFKGRFLKKELKRAEEGESLEDYGFDRR